MILATIRHGVFQSTSPVRGTTPRTSPFLNNLNISIHVPRAGDDFFQIFSHCRLPISIHVPRAGDDEGYSMKKLTVNHFNPRPPCGGRQPKEATDMATKRISIHVPRAGDDLSTLSLSCASEDFNPRPPCGGRQQNRTIFQVIATRFALLFTNRIIKSDFILSLYPIFLHFSSANPCLFYKQHPLRTIIKSDSPQGHMILSSHIVRFLKNISFRDYRFVCCPFLHP